MIATAPSRPERRRRAAKWLVLPVLVALILILPSESVQAASPTVLTAPYAGTRAVAGENGYQYCQGTLRIGHAHWDPTTGGLRVKDKASTHGCPGNVGGSSGYSWQGAQSTLTLSIPFTGSGNRNVTVDFAWAETTTGSVGNSNCKFVAVPSGDTSAREECYWLAYWWVTVYASLFDLTNQTTVSQDSAEWQVGNYTYALTEASYNSSNSHHWSNTSYGYGCGGFVLQDAYTDANESCVPSGTLSGTQVLWLNTSSPIRQMPLVAGHKYAVVIELSVQDYIFWDNNGGGTPTSVISHTRGDPGFASDVSSGTNGMVLKSVTL